MNIQWKGAKAFQKERNGTKIDRIVIHWIAEGTLDTATSWFNRTNATTSAHYGIEDGKIYQWVKDEDTAYHAGNWAMNLRSIGIEHSATPQRPLTDASYETSAELVYHLCHKYNIPLDRQHIIQHKEVKATACPGTVDIDRIIRQAKQKGEPSMDLQKERDARNANWEFGIDKGVFRIAALYGIARPQRDPQDDKSAWDNFVNQVYARVQQDKERASYAGELEKKLQEEMAKPASITNLEQAFAYIGRTLDARK